MKMFRRGDDMWRHFNQVRDQTENDNMTAFMQMQNARAWERWAASKRGNSSFAAMCHSAACHAQKMRRASRS